MRVNGLVHLIRKKDATYWVTYTPLGVPPTSCSSRSFPNEKELERFLAGPLKINWGEIVAALNALSRNGSYCIYDVGLSEAEIQEHGLATAWSLSCSRAGLCYPAELLASS